MNRRTYRLHRSPAWFGRWVVQVLSPDGVWGDVGEPCDSLQAAVRKENALKEEDRRGR